MERGISKILTFVIRYIASKIFGKIILKPLYRKDSISPRMTEKVQILKRRLAECISRDQSTLDSVKVFSVYLRENRRCVPLLSQPERAF